MVKKLLLFAVAGLMLAQAAGIASAEEEFSLALAKAKVDAAAKLIESEGEEAFAKIKDPNGEFRFADGKGYIWVHNLQTGIMALHPVQPALEGTSANALKDSTGFAFILAMNKVVKDNSSGWVVYLWPQPGQVLEDKKGSYVKFATFKENDYVVGCGIYGVTKNVVMEEFPDDVVIDAETYKKY